jgi:activator of HSP90 ATPase
MDFKKYFKIKAPVQDVYNAIVNPDLIELWTGEEALMDDQPGTEFSLYGGNIVGKNISLEKEKKIVQHWYFGDEKNPSEVTMIFHAEKNKTSVEIRQTNIPEDAFENISEGWSYAYFEPIRELLEEE